MFKKRTKAAITLIAAATEVVGDISFAGQLYVYGRVLGNISALDGSASLIVCEDGEIRGDIRVPNVIVNGDVKGDVYGKSKVEISSKACVQGNVYYSLIEMQLGARIEGQLIHAEKIQNQEANILVLVDRKSGDL